MSIMSHIKPIVFTDSEYWIKRCNHYKVRVVTDYEYVDNISTFHANRRNPYQLPYLFGMFERAIEEYPNENFYGYINGDILVENTIHDVLVKVQKDINSGILNPRVCPLSLRCNRIVGRYLLPTPQFLFQQHNWYVHHKYDYLLVFLMN